MIPAGLVILIAALVAALAWALRRQSQRAKLLRAQIEAATKELQQLQEACARLAPAGVVQRLVADGADHGPERKVVTALFSDLVGYTAMSERLEPAVLARILNGCFQRMSDAIHEHRGHVSTVPMPAETVKGIDEPVVTFAVRE